MKSHEFCGGYARSPMCESSTARVDSSRCLVTSDFSLRHLTAALEKVGRNAARPTRPVVPHRETSGHPRKRAESPVLGDSRYNAILGQAAVNGEYRQLRER